MSNCSRPQVGQAMRTGPRSRSFSALRISHATLTSSSAWKVESEIRIVSPTPSASSVPRPTADLSEPDHFVPASVMPRWSGYGIRSASSRFEAIVLGTLVDLIETLKFVKSSRSMSSTNSAAAVTSASTGFSRSSACRCLGSEPELTPMRMGVPSSLARFATSATLSGPPMLPGFSRTQWAPASRALSASVWLKWMSAITGIGDSTTIVLSASTSSSRGTATRTMSAPASATRRIWSIVACRFAVSVLVIVWTATGAPPPMGTPPTWICRFEAMALSVRSHPVPEPVNVADYEAAAAHALDPGPLGYFAGGAGDERTLRANVDAYARHRLMPRVMVDVSETSAATTVLGTPVSMPVIVAPVALQRMAHPDGEPGMSRAAKEAGTVMTLSTISTSRPSEVAEAAPGAPRWFQVYVLKDRSVTRALVDEAVEHGFRALVLTVDAPRAGRRERDLRTAFAVPHGIDMPAVSAAVGGSEGITPAGFFSLMDTTITWRELEQLVDESPVPVLLKGVHSAADARLAVEHGAAGVVVSNHGGRQLDTVPASIDMLPAVVDEVGDDAEVFVDGGVRRGTDVLVALALGARAVLVGRPALWGLAVGGEAGALRVLELLREEVELGLTLLGAPTPADVTRAHLA